jgi:hypothetical protein
VERVDLEQLQEIVIASHRELRPAPKAVQGGRAKVLLKSSNECFRLVDGFKGSPKTGQFITCNPNLKPNVPRKPAPSLQGKVTLRPDSENFLSNGSEIFPNFLTLRLLHP